MIKKDNVSIEEMANYFRAGISSDAELYGVVSSISTPMLDMPLKNSLVINKGTDYGDFTRSQSGLSTHFDIHGIMRYSKANTPRFAKEGLLFEGSASNYIADTSFSTWDGVFGATLNNDFSPDGTKNAMTMNKTIMSYTTSVTTAGYYTYSIWLKGALGGEVVALQMSTSSTQVLDGGGSNSTSDVTLEGGYSNDVAQSEVDATTSEPLVSTDVTYIVEASQVLDGTTAGLTSPDALVDGGEAGTLSSIVLDGDDAGGAISTPPAGILMRILTLSNKWERYTMTEYFSGGQPLRVILQSPGASSAFAPQLEKGSIASSFIPTSGNKVGTRGADILTLQGTNIPHVTDEKTIILDFTPIEKTTPMLRELVRAEGGQYNIIRCLANGEYTMYYKGGGLQLIKCEVGRTDRIAYVQSGGKTSNIKAYINNIYVNSVTESVLTDAPTTSITIGNGTSGNYPAWGYIKNLRIYNKALNHTSLLLS